MIQHKKRPHWMVLAGLLVVVIGSAAVCIRVDSFNANMKRLAEKLHAAITAEPYAPPVDYIFDGDTLRLVNDKDATLLTLTAEGTDVISSWLTVRDQAGQEIAVANPQEIAAFIDSGATSDAASVAAADAASVAASVAASAATSGGGSVAYHYELPDYGTLILTRFGDHFILDGMILSVVEGDIFPFRKSGTPIDINEPIAAFGFKGYETWGTGRGYIWSRSLPLMLRHGLLGSGPDSFINVFPQDDILGKLHYLYDPYIIVDKAHNLYLQTSITTGFFSMAALVFLIGYYLITTFISLLTAHNERLPRFGLRLGLLAAVSAFAVSSLATDSTIPSSGIFYCLLGLGYALNIHNINA